MHKTMLMPEPYIAEPESGQFGGVDFSNLPYRELRHVSGRTGSAFEIIFREQALAKIHTHGDAHYRLQIWGVLVGDVYQDATGSFLLIEDVVESAAPAPGGGYVTFAVETWQAIQTAMEQKFPHLRLVGWYRTHPGTGAELSDMDVYVHNSFFNLPWQVAMVYDPLRGQERIFTDHDGTLSRGEFLVERDEPIATPPPLPEPPPAPVVQRVVEQPRSEPMATLSAVAIAEAAAARVRRRATPMRIIGKSILGIIGLALFGVMGYLLAILLLQWHPDMSWLPFHLR